MPTQVETNPFLYSDSNKRYYAYDYFLRQTFGGKCAKLPLDGGFSCPNRDGTRGVGGCLYCSPRGSGDFCEDAALPIDAQLKAAHARLSKKWENPRCIAYFQAFTGTYAPLRVLREKYEAALQFPDVVGLSIATRADCLPDDVVAYLASLAERTHLTVELGLQTIHDVTAARIHRGHTFAEFLEGYGKLRAASQKINIGVHIINGLPGEDGDMMLETMRRVAELHPQQVKIHLLHILKATPLAAQYERGEFRCLSLDEYANLVAQQLTLLPPDTVIGRLTGDGAADSLLAPLWSRKKFVVMNTIDRLMFQQDLWQGKSYR